MSETLKLRRVTKRTRLPEQAMLAFLEDMMERADGPMAACLAEITSIPRILTVRPFLPGHRRKDIEKHLENIERLKTQIGLAVLSQSVVVLLAMEKILACNPLCLSSILGIRLIEEPSSGLKRRYLEEPGRCGVKTALRNRRLVHLFRRFLDLALNSSIPLADGNPGRRENHTMLGNHHNLCFIANKIL
ncbi:hypothetical protein N657DRAFT_187129 [Parathielavia appendiculata]|uniref:Uncharacterized protein n=1 Tax=Parathielavia appendiculata TaxID=2587402 RepID=A0AAN6U5X9_9PEZI|nr:hypothetical protein N657DRAFT_187129 [Parathielavia appendiculata]